jgi:hypothetical protein
MRPQLLPIVLGLLLAGCTAQVAISPTPSASASPGPSATASPAAQASPTTIPLEPSSPPAYAILVDLLSSPSQYTVALVAGDGSVASTITAARRSAIANAGGHAFELPYISTTRTSLYFLDGDAAIWQLVPGKPKSLVMSLPTGPGVEATFAVSPDDSQLAYGLLDFNRQPVHVKLGLVSFGGDTPARVTFESDSDYVWPVAWHAGLLVLAHAYGPYQESTTAAGPDQANPYGAVSYHLVNPVTTERGVLLGQCTVSGPLNAAGTACIQGGTLDWGGSDRNWGTRNWGSISAAASVSPDGTRVAAAEPATPERLGFWRPDGTEETWVNGAGANNWAGWLDQGHIVIASHTNASFQPTLIPVAGGRAVPIAARGFYAARLPTDIV